MRMMFKSFAKKLFGVKYERIGKNFLTGLIVFLGLRSAELRLVIAPFILYLMTAAFTAGVMWQALSSEENTDSMTNLFMLPFDGWKLTFSYVGALGSYTLFTKTWLLLAVVYAISNCDALEIACSILCAVNAIVVSVSVYSMQKYRVTGMLWSGLLIVLIFAKIDTIVFFMLLLANLTLAVLILKKADAYAFYQRKQTKHQIKGTRRHSLWRYFFRYFMAHKNYLANTFIMWGAACLLPLMFAGMEKNFVMPIGFAILSLNTPICILLSCDPALEQAVRFLPGQKKAFFVPYCLFIFLCNMMADIIFLASWQIQLGGISWSLIGTACFFAMQSVVGSVLLERFFPIRGWKIESDLWHHPRKYVVPGIMLLLAGLVGSVKWVSYGFPVVLFVECTVLLLAGKD